MINKKNLITAAFAISALSACTRTEYRDRIVPSPAAQITSCDRGVDFTTTAPCDRNIQDQTFWLGSVEVNVKTKEKKGLLRGTKTIEHKIKANVAYEFTPPTNEQIQKGELGNITRSIFIQDPVTARQLGYRESGYLTRISHEALDIVITSSTCPTEQREGTNNQALTVYYERDSAGIIISKSEPRNLFENLVLLPVLIMLKVIENVVDILSYQTVHTIFEHDVQLKPYQFSTDLLPVEWGCSTKGDFAHDPSTPIRL